MGKKFESDARGGGRPHAPREGFRAARDHQGEFDVDRRTRASRWTFDGGCGRGHADGGGDGGRARVWGAFVRTSESSGCALPENTLRRSRWGIVAASSGMRGAFEMSPRPLRLPGLLAKMLSLDTVARTRCVTSRPREGRTTGRAMTRPGEAARRDEMPRTVGVMMADAESIMAAIARAVPRLGAGGARNDRKRRRFSAEKPSQTRGISFVARPRASYSVRAVRLSRRPGRLGQNAASTRRVSDRIQSARLRNFTPGARMDGGRSVPRRRPFSGCRAHASPAVITRAPHTQSERGRLRAHDLLEGHAR